MILQVALLRFQRFHNLASVGWRKTRFPPQRLFGALKFTNVSIQNFSFAKSQIFLPKLSFHEDVHRWGRKDQRLES